MFFFSKSWGGCRGRVIFFCWEFLWFFWLYLGVGFWCFFYGSLIYFVLFFIMFMSLEDVSVYSSWGRWGYVDIGSLGGRGRWARVISGRGRRVLFEFRVFGDIFCDFCWVLSDVSFVLGIGLGLGGIEVGGFSFGFRVSIVWMEIL